MTRWKSPTGILLVASSLVFLLVTPALGADFGLTELNVSSTAKDGSPAVQAGSHPFSVTTDLAVQTEEVPLGSGNDIPVQEAKDVNISFPPGFVGNPTAVPRCTAAQFLAGGANGACPDASALGTARIEYGGGGGEHEVANAPVYNLYPSPGKAAKLGFIVEGVAPVTVDVAINPNPPYNVVAIASNISQGVFFLAAKINVWGVPAASAHDGDRGACLFNNKLCEVSIPETPFLTLPTSCASPLSFDFEADSWQNPSGPGVPYPFKASTTVHDNSTPPNALSPAGCAKLEFAPQISTQPTSHSAESASGLDVDVTVQDEGINNPAEGASAASTIKRTVLTLPQGVTINPSQAEGLGACTEIQLGLEGANSEPGEGCPQSSKIGTVEVESPLLEGEILPGALYVATPYKNPYGTLIAFYIVIKDPKLGILVKLPAKVVPDEKTGQLVTTLGDPPYEIPQLPFSHFHFHFREGGRSPLVTPSTCGTYTTKTVFTPWSNPSAPYATTSTFNVTSGVGGASCPVGAPPFAPGFEAGSLDNNAGAYSPVYMRLTRKDGEQDMTRFSSIFPPGLVGKIAGIPKCSDAAIAAAKLNTGLAELASPSCPSGSAIGRVLVGAGVGSELTYVAGKIYLAGPYNGAPLSVAVITPAVAGPFDVGDVVVREGLDLNPETAEVEVDGAASDPIPHILAGIPLKIRDLRVYADRPQFTLNPTSCEESQFRAILYGDSLDIFNPADDVPVALADRFQAADCQSLAFKPRLSFKLSGGTRRNKYPALRAVVTPRAGQANIGRTIVTLPHSAFLEQGHIGTICTRAQFADQACPAASVYGSARAISPLLDEPLEGPVYLRANGGERNLPDLVVALHGLIDINLVGYIDSVNARIRARFLHIPDAPVSKFVLSMAGGKKGLIVNSTNICKGSHRATANLGGQNGKPYKIQPAVKAECGRKPK